MTTTTMGTEHERTEKMVAAQRARRTAAVAAAKASGPEAVAAVEDALEVEEAAERVAMRRMLDAEVTAKVGPLVEKK